MGRSGRPFLFSTILPLLLIVAIGFWGAGCTAPSTGGGGDGNTAADATTQGFPAWSVPDSYLLVSTPENEFAIQLPDSISQPLVLAESSGSGIYQYEQINLNTIRITEVGNNGGFVHLTLLPDKRYRLFVYVRNQSVSIGFTQITREFGRYQFSGTQITFTPTSSSSETRSNNGSVSNQSHSLSPKVFEVTAAVFKEVAGSNPRTNQGYILRGPCQAFSFPVTCISSSSAELRFQPLAVK